jgi:hypothetical protein
MVTDFSLKGRSRPSQPTGFSRLVIESNYRRLEQNRIVRDKYFSVSIAVNTMQHLGTWLGDDIVFLIDIRTFDIKPILELLHI